jgi:anti-sigma B factor antagonist
MRYLHQIRQDTLILNFQENLILPNPDQELILLIDDAILQGIIHCAINLSEIQYMNSAGIGLLMRILAKFRNQEGEVVLIKPSPTIQKLLLITKLNAIFTIVESEEQAIEVLKKDS